jgi:phosphoesterase RecJ-like protein
MTAAVELLRSVTDVTLLAHVRPDPDAFGSALALGRVLARRGAGVRVSFAEPAELPETLDVLDDDGLFVPADRLPETEQLIVALDSASAQRLGGLAARVTAAQSAGTPVLVVDHHAANTRYGTHHVLDESAEATAVLVLRLIDALGADVDEPVARCLYAGLYTDTGGFRRATPDTHRVAARLLEAGVEPDRIARRIVDEHPFAWLPLLSEVLASARLDPSAAQGLGLVYTVVRADVVRAARLEEVEDVVNVLRSAREAEVALVLKEFEREVWTVSLRAVGRIDVSAAARALGGGGHRLAAGCTVPGSSEQVIARVRAALEAAPLL